MEISISIPEGAKFRILRDPHSLPHVPRSIASEVALEKQHQRRRRLSEDGLNNRRAKVHMNRSQRIPDWVDYRSSDRDTPCETPTRRGSDSAISDSPTHHEIRGVLLNGSPTSKPQHDNMFFPNILEEREPAVLDRVRFRSRFCKKPTPGMRNRDFSVNREGKRWQGHPSWHRLLRHQYAFWGLDSSWREERCRFLQDKRRDSAFNKQKQRRMTF